MYVGRKGGLQSKTVSMRPLGTSAQDSIHQTTEFPGFAEAWQQLRAEYEPYGDFADFIEEMRTRPK